MLFLISLFVSVFSEASCEWITDEKLTSINASTYQGCEDKLEQNDPNLPPSLETIGKSTFEGFTKLTGTLTIPINVTSIGDSAFARTGISGIVFEGNLVQSIGTSAFEECSSLTSISLPFSISLISLILKMVVLA